MFIKGCKCAQMGAFFDLHMCVTLFFNIGTLFVHTLRFMPPQISVTLPLYPTKWTSFLSKAPIMN